MKKVENYLKREDEIQAWRDGASPEDIEYLECQIEMAQDLFQSYLRVERIVGVCFISICSCLFNCMKFFIDIMFCLCSIFCERGQSRTRLPCEVGESPIF